MFRNHSRAVFLPERLQATHALSGAQLQRQGRLRPERSAVLHAVTNAYLYPTGSGGVADAAERRWTNWDSRVSNTTADSYLEHPSRIAEPIPDHGVHASRIAEYGNGARETFELSRGI